MTFVQGSVEPPPHVRRGADDSLRCFDPACDAQFGRRVAEGYLLFAPGWVFQGAKWRSRSIEIELAAEGDDSLLAVVLKIDDRVPHKRNEPDRRVIFVTSRLPASVLCPDCGHLQTADPDDLDASEARTSLEATKPRWLRLRQWLSRVVVRRARRRRRSP